MKLLIIEDDKAIVTFLKRGLCEDGHVVDSADNGADGEYLAALYHYDVIVLDWMLPEKSGIEVLETLRDKGIKTPVIMLTAKGELENRITGLNIGADDYLTKPFAYAELLARIEALHRRVVSDGSNTVSCGNLVIDTYAKTVMQKHLLIECTKKEYELLLFLINHRNAIVSSSMIEEQLWSQESFINSNVIQVTIYTIRKKFGKSLIKSYRGLGYKIEA